MDFVELFERFPHIGKQIFEKLDNKNLTKCREVCKSWQKFIGDENIPWNRILMKFPTAEGMHLKTEYHKRSQKYSQLLVLKYSEIILFSYLHTSWDQQIILKK